MPRSADVPVPMRRRYIAPRVKAASVVFALTLAVYVATFSPGLDYVDHGELSAVATTLGIAHPTGYPTLMLLGHVVAKLAPMRPVLALNLLVVLLVAGSAATLVLLFDELLTSGTASPVKRALVAACAALATAFSGTWWDQADHFEVYSLHVLFMSLVVFLFLRWTRTGWGGPAFAFAVGLSFTNHMTTVLLAPGLLTCWIATRGISKVSALRLPALAPWFLLGLTPYLYLPLRSVAEPRFDWDDPETYRGFLNHVTGHEYQSWLYRDPGVFQLQSEFFFSRLPVETGYAGLLLALAGLVWLVARAPRHALLVALLFAASIALAGGYGIPDIRPYYLTAVLATGMSLSAGLSWMLSRFGVRSVVVLGGALVGLVLGTNFREQHQPPAPVETLARDVLEPLPPRALMLTGQWDQWLSASLYLQEVEGLRRDVTVVSSAGLWRPWYLDELSRRAPWLATRMSAEIEGVRRATASFERGGSRGDHAIDVAYLVLLEAIVVTALRDRAVFVTRDVVADLPKRIRTIPEGLGFRVVTDTAYVPQPPWPSRFSPMSARRDMYGAITCELYARSALDRAYYELSRGRASAAERSLEIARGFDPGWRAETILPPPWGARAMLAKSLAFFDALRELDLEGLRRNLPAQLEARPRPRSR